MEPKPIDGAPIAKWAFNNSDNIWQLVSSLIDQFGGSNHEKQVAKEKAEKKLLTVAPKEDPPIRMIDFEL